MIFSSSHREKVQRLKFSSSLIVMNLYSDLILNRLTVTTSELRFPKSIAVRNVQSGSFRFCCHAADGRAKFIGIKCIFVLLVVCQSHNYYYILKSIVNQYTNICDFKLDQQPNHMNFTVVQSCYRHLQYEVSFSRSSG